MPKDPKNLGSQLMWGALAMIPLAAVLVYFSKQTPRALIKDSLVSNSNSKPKVTVPPEEPSPENFGALQFSSPDSSEIHSQIQKVFPAPELLKDNSGTNPSPISTESSSVPIQETHPITTSKAESEAPLLQPNQSLSAPPVNALLNPHSTVPANSLSGSSTNSSDSSRTQPITLQKTESLDRVSLDPYKAPPKQGFQTVQSNEGQPRRALLSQISPADSNPGDSSSTTPTPSTIKNRGPNSDPSTSQPSNTKNDSGPEDDDPPPFPSANDSKNGQGGTKLSLAKPYCFLLPKGSPAVKCAMESVKLIVEEYAKADVHVIPIFRWWGDDYSSDPNALEQQAIEACNLQAAFPWLEGGNKVASIQAFVREPIPSVQCGKDPEKDPVAGCSNLCPSGSPSFSTVSEQKCSAGVALHESGHSNCCAAQCKNQGDCKPPPGTDAGCGLCLETGGMLEASKNRLQRIFAAEDKESPSSCQLTAAALESIRAGASRNPGYLYNPKKKYKPGGKKLNSIYSKKTGKVKKLKRGVGDKADGDGSGADGTPMSSDSGATTTRRTTSSPTGGTQNNDEDVIVPSDNPKGYTPEEINRFTTETPTD